MVTSSFMSGMANTILRLYPSMVYQLEKNSTHPQFENQGFTFYAAPYLNKMKVSFEQNGRQFL